MKIFFAFIVSVYMYTVLSCIRLEAQRSSSSSESLSDRNRLESPTTWSAWNALGKGSDCQRENQRRCRRSASNSTESDKVLHILSMLPYPDPEGREAFQPSWDEGPTLFIAKQLAVELINNRTDILNGYTIDLIQGDSGCNLRSKANQATFEKLLFNTAEPPVGIVGPGCSNSALTVSSLIRRQELSMLTIHVAGSLLLSNRSLYEYSFGTLDSTTVFVEASLALMRRNDWKKVGILYDESRLYYSSTAREFEMDLRSTNFSYFSSAVYDTYIPLDVIVAERIRVIFLLVGPDFLSRILCLAYHSNVKYPIYQFIIVSRVTEEIEPVTFTYMGNSISCTQEQMTDVINGSLIIHYQLQSFENPTEVGLSYNRFFEMYQQRVQDYNQQRELSTPISTSFWAASFFDAVWSMALAMNASIENITELQDMYNGTVPFYGSGLADALRKNLLKRNFSGLSGNIAYNESSGYVIRNVNVYKINAKQMDLIAYYNKLNNSIVLMASEEGSFVNGTFRTERTINSVSLVAGIIFLTITVMSLILTILLHILTIIYRQQKSVKASSVKLSHVAFIGCYVLVLCGVVNFMVECLSGLPSTAKCNLFHILNASASLGGTLLFGPICARTWRLYRIYVHFTKPGKLISDWFLLTVILVLFSFNLFLVIISSALHPFRPHDNVTAVLNEVKDGREQTTEVVIMESVTVLCSQNNYYAWFGSMIMSTILLMLCSFWLAIRTRHIPHRNFQTHSISLLVYLLSGFITVSLLFYFIFTINLVEYIALSVALNVSVYFSCLLLFFPPLCPMLKHKWPFSVFHHLLCKIKV